MESIGIRSVRLLKLLIKIAIMFLIITGVILINKRYMSNADGCEKKSHLMSLEKRLVGFWPNFDVN